MSSIRYKNFSRPGFLKRIRPEVLRDLLRPQRDYFESRGLDLNGAPDSAVDCDLLGQIFATPDHDTPTALIEAIETCDAVCSPETLEELVEIDQLRDHNILRGHHSLADAVILTWLHEPEVIERIFNRAALEIDRSLFVYRATRPLRAGAFEPRSLRKLESALAPAFESRLHGAACRITAYERSHGGWALMIQHGDPVNKTESILDSGESQPLVFRPERMDIAFYDPETLEWRISGRAKWLQELYSRHFAGVFTEEGGRLMRSNCYTLEPLEQQGLSVLSHQNHEVRQVRLAELRVSISGATVSITGRDLTKAFESLHTPLFELGQLKGARLAFTLANRSAALPVTINRGRGSVRGDIDHPAIEDWLQATGFVTTTTISDHDPSLVESR